ncbi:four helix bundle protein [Desulfurobacterium thermolithotrophum]|uniref:four helix bundle protein n=1 Tax=Desulfurobacterium thermolithotrophum TaxID=64160 RepID=UPI001954F900
MVLRNLRSGRRVRNWPSIYQVTNKGSFSRDYGLRDQIRRAAVSIPSNIISIFLKDHQLKY